MLYNGMSHSELINSLNITDALFDDIWQLNANIIDETAAHANTFAAR